MKRWRRSSRAILLAGAAAISFAIPAFGQPEEGPELLLPPGFGDPPAAVPPDTAPRAEPIRSPQSAPPSALVPPERAPGGVEDAAAEDLEELAAIPIPPAIEIPETSRRATNPAGPLGPDNWGLGPNAFGKAQGRFLTSLMGGLDAPLPSRWASILLRRALLSRVPTPGAVQDVDWVAERAWLLLRMGEADGARALVQAIDVDRFTPRMYTVAVQVALATADPAALCPLVEEGRKTSDEPVWPLADAMCAALEGEAARASQLIDQARRRSGAGGIDVLLAEKVVGAGADTRRAVTIQWEGVDQLNSWRFGLASATGLEIPPALLGGAGLHVRAWHARAPMVPLQDRVAAAHAAASIGVFSHAALVEMFSLLADGTDPSEIEQSIGGRLRRAYVARDAQDRVEIMKSLWDEPRTAGDRFARQILTATAAAGIPPSEALAARAEDLIASMLTAGLDAPAAAWSALVDGLDGEGDRAWAMLAIASKTPAVDLSPARVEDFVDGDTSESGHRGRMLVAALAGLGRLEDPASLGVDPAPRTRWARMLAAAARTDQPGTVALLAAVGMQTPDWRGVPPDHLYQIVAALRRVGLEYEARMIAAEALSRL